MPERVVEVRELTRRKLELALRFFSEGDMAETIHYVWVVFENSLNIVKDTMNNAPLLDHKPKTEMFAIYSALGILKRDYSHSFALLERLRIRADFGPYSRTPRIPGKDAVATYLAEAEALFREAEAHTVSPCRPLAPGGNSAPR